MAAVTFAMIDGLGGAAMDSRGVVASALVVMTLIGPVAPRALAQQPAAPAEPAPAVQQAPLPPQTPPAAVIIEAAPAEPVVQRGTDFYDIAAGAMTVGRAPFNVAICALGFGAATVLFISTLGSSNRAAMRTVEEGCAQRWVVRGDDIRPAGAPGVF